MSNFVQTTEVVDKIGKEMDLWSANELAAHLCSTHWGALNGKEAEVSEQLATVGEAIVQRLRNTQGRLIYCGAGSAGAQACIDGLELPGTFGWPRERLVLLLAGGWESFFSGGSAAEDNTEEAVDAILSLGLAEDDVLIAVSASGTTPYTLAAVLQAKQSGALTVGICNNTHSTLAQDADVSIVLETGSEVVAGSTRLAAGTAQKIVLNGLSTLVMAKLGYLYGNLMVRMVVSNQKLIARATKIVACIAECDDTQALQWLEKAEYHISEAVLMKNGLSFDAAKRCLEVHHHNLRAALSSCA